jgi:uncharacterized protein YfiM (DUF2279 family)
MTHNHHYRSHSKSHRHNHSGRKRHKQKRNKTVFWKIAAVISVLVAIPLIFLSYAIDSYALVVSTESIDADSAGKAKVIAQQLRQDLINPEASLPYNQFTLSENEINGIIALGMRGINGFKGRANITPLGIKIAFTYKSPLNLFGDYINLLVTIIPSQKGLVLQDASIGRIKVPGNIAMSAVETILNGLLSGEDTGTVLIQSIESVTVENSRLTLVYHVIPNLRELFVKTKGRIKNIRDDLELLGDPAIVRLYYHRLCDFHKQIASIAEGNISLGYYMREVFDYARIRSLMGKDPVEENRAGLLALAIFFGSSHFNSAVGAIDEETMAACSPSGSQAVLADRIDLRLHFIYSAALKVISSSSMSFALGEFKELSDSQKGGSGFSFADLAADRAGVRFAELILDSADPLRIQLMAKELTREDVFFPSLSALPEDMPQYLFEKHGGIESDYYRRHLKIINNRIDSLTLYNTSQL